MLLHRWSKVCAVLKPANPFLSSKSRKMASESMITAEFLLNLQLNRKLCSSAFLWRQEVLHAICVSTTWLMKLAVPSKFLELLLIWGATGQNFRSAPDVTKNSVLAKLSRTSLEIRASSATTQFEFFTRCASFDGLHTKSMHVNPLLSDGIKPAGNIIFIIGKLLRNCWAV